MSAVTPNPGKDTEPGDDYQRLPEKAIKIKLLNVKDRLVLLQCVLRPSTTLVHWYIVNTEPSSLLIQRTV